MYQLFVYFQPDLEPDALQKALDTCTKQLGSHKGSVHTEDKVKKISLAYPIEKKQFAYAWMSQVEVPTDQVAEFESYLLQNVDVLRHTLTKTTPPSKVAASQKRQSRLDERAQRNAASNPKEEEKAKEVSTEISDKELEVAKSTETEKPKVDSKEIEKKLDDLLEGKL